MKKLSFSFFCIIMFITNIVKISAQTESNLNAYTPQIYYPNLQNEYSKNKKLEVENRSLFEPKNTTILSTELYGDIAYVGCDYAPFSGITTPVYHNYYETDINGKEIRETKIGLVYGVYDSVVMIKNQKFKYKNQDIQDTATYYKKSYNGTYIPSKRYINNYYYYDKFETDSFYSENILQRWDKQWENWKDSIITRYYYRDTLVEYIYKYENLVFDEKGDIIKEGFVDDSLVFDNNGFVTEMYQTLYNGEDPNTYYKYVFINDETGRPHEITRYIKEEGETEYWKNLTWINYIWKEWHGFSFESIRPIGSELFSPYAKKNKLESYQIVQNGDTIGLRQKWWNTDAFGSKTDTTYFYDKAKNKYPFQSFSDFYNDHDDYVAFVLTSWDTWPGGTGSHQKKGHLEYLWDFIYEKPFGKKEEKVYLIGIDDTSFLFHTIKDFTFVGIPAIDSPNDFAFSIAPNPATGYTKIAAQEEIQYIEIFDLTGRLMKTEAVYNQEATVSFNNLSQGVYLLKAVFKKGGARTQKLIVQ